MTEPLDRTLAEIVDSARSNSIDASRGYTLGYTRISLSRAKRLYSANSFCWSALVQQSRANKRRHTYQPLPRTRVEKPNRVGGCI